MTESIKRNVTMVYLSSIIPSALSYFFWILVSNLSGSEMVGMIAALISFSAIIGYLSHFEVAYGQKRFLGKALAKKNYSEFKAISSASIILLLISSIAILLITFNPWFDFLSLVDIDRKFIPVLAALVIGNVLINVFRQVLISLLKSKLILIPTIIAAIARLPVLLLLFYFVELSDVDIAWIYAIFYIIAVPILLFYVLKLLNEMEGPLIHKLFNKMKLVFSGSVSIWLPGIIAVLGTQLSVLSVYSIKGASAGGLFFIPFALFNVLQMLSGAIIQVSHPIVGGMEKLENQVFMLKKMLKFAFLGTMPLVGVVLAYSEEILLIFGKEFSASDQTLVILMYAFPLGIISVTLNLWLFARGKYTLTFLIQISSNIPRIIFYFYLIPLYGGVGSAIAFTIGLAIEIIIGIIILERMKIQLKYSLFIIVSVIPLSLAYGLELIESGYIGILLILIISYVVFIKMKLITEDDIQDIFGSIFDSSKSKIISDSVIRKFKRIHLL